MKLWCVGKCWEILAILFICFPFTLWAIWWAFNINIFDMLVCILVCFYLTIFAWLLLTFSQIWEFLYVFCIYIVGHLVCLFYIHIFDNKVCFLVCFYVKICVWLLFPFFSNMGVPLHSLYTKFDLIQRIDKCIYVFSLWHSGVLANVGKYW